MYSTLYFTGALGYSLEIGKLVFLEWSSSDDDVELVDVLCCFESFCLTDLFLPVLLSDEEELPELLRFFGFIWVVMPMARSPFDGFFFPSFSSSDAEELVEDFLSFSFCLGVSSSFEDAELVELFLNALNNRDFFLRFSVFSLLSSLSEEEDEDELDEPFCFVSEPSSPGKTTSIFCLTSLSSVNVLFLGAGGSSSSSDAEQMVTFSSTLTKDILPGLRSIPSFPISILPSEFSSSKPGFG